MAGLLAVIYNPICGDRTGKPFFTEHVLPLLASHGKKPDLVLETTHEGHAGSAVAAFLQEHPAQETVSLILGSGDGTLHEVINELYFAKGLESARIRIAPVPCGTANALYSSLFPPSKDGENGVEYKLQSVKALLEGNARSEPVSLAVTQLQAAKEAGEGGKGRGSLLSAVVTSTSLHAAILDTSEALRDEYPGLERFKIAAERNSRKWFKARAGLLPQQDKTSVEIYDSKLGAFVPASEGALELQGPFAYFLSTINVDRLEPTFFITPLSRTIAAPPGTCDVVVIRPLRDPKVQADSQEAREGFVPKTWAAMMGAYQEGAHIKLRYGEGEELVQEGDGENVVEYYRCGGWEWYPDPEDKDAHLVCTDGAISRIEANSWAECRVSTAPEGRPKFELYVA